MAKNKKIKKIRKKIYLDKVTILNYYFLLHTKKNKPDKNIQKLQNNNKQMKTKQTNK